MKLKATRGCLLVKDIVEEGGFSTPPQRGDMRKAKVIDVGQFLWHISHEKIEAEPHVGDVVYFCFNGNEQVPGTDIYSIIQDQLRAYEQHS